MEVLYTPSFIRQLKTFSTDLQEEIFEKVELFQNPKNHVTLKVHKLKGRLAGKYSFSVNYKTRIVFIYGGKKEAILLAVGTHEVYKK